MYDWVQYLDRVETDRKMRARLLVDPGSYSDPEPLQSYLAYAASVRQPITQLRVDCGYKTNVPFPVMPLVIAPHS